MVDHILIYLQNLLKLKKNTAFKNFQVDLHVPSLNNHGHVQYTSILATLISGWREYIYNPLVSKSVVCPVIEYIKEYGTIFLYARPKNSHCLARTHAADRLEKQQNISINSENFGDKHIQVFNIHLNFWHEMIFFVLRAKKMFIQILFLRQKKMFICFKTIIHEFFWHEMIFFALCAKKQKNIHMDIFLERKKCSQEKNNHIF